MKYFGYYADDRKQNNVNCTLAAVNKMHYIAKCLAGIYGETEIISAVTPKIGKQKSELYAINEHINVRYFYAKTSANKVINVIERFINNARLFIWMIKNIKSEESIIVYHSLGYMNLFKVLKRIKKIKLFLEIEEIYGDVLCSEKIREKELQFFAFADGYIFPTKLLSQLINKNKKPEAIIHGTYEVEKEIFVNIFGTEKNNIKHILYAGTFDSQKGGANAAIKSVKFLPKNYHMHILGFGTEKDVKQVKELIAKINDESNAFVTYDGLKSGSEYIQFVQSCDVGLSTQDPSASFNDTSFPSKILSYLSNGIKVVSVRIPAVETSNIGDLVFYYDEQSPQKIAEAIIEACKSKEVIDSRNYIEKLNQKFILDLSTLLK